METSAFHGPGVGYSDPVLPDKGLDDVLVYDTRPDWYADDRPLDLGTFKPGVWEPRGRRKRPASARVDPRRGLGALLAQVLGTP